MSLLSVVVSGGGGGGGVQLHHFKGDQMSDISWHHILCSRARLIVSDLQSYVT